MLSIELGFEELGVRVRVRVLRRDSKFERYYQAALGILAPSLASSLIAHLEATVDLGHCCVEYTQSGRFPEVWERPRRLCEGVSSHGET